MCGCVKALSTFGSAFANGTPGAVTRFPTSPFKVTRRHLRPDASPSQLPIPNHEHPDLKPRYTEGVFRRHVFAAAKLPGLIPSRSSRSPKVQLYVPQPRPPGNVVNVLSASRHRSHRSGCVLCAMRDAAAGYCRRSAACGATVVRLPSRPTVQTEP